MGETSVLGIPVDFYLLPHMGAFKIAEKQLCATFLFEGPVWKIL